MKKKKRSWKLPTAFFGLFFFGIIMCCSGIHFPFINAKYMLNLRLNRDFGVKLPNSALITKSYWVAARDPEHVFKIEILPADLKPFIDSIQATATAKKYTMQAAMDMPHFGPLYGAPPWWNAPPLTDATPTEIFIHEGGGSHYRFLYSPSTGTTYLVWGGF